MNANDILLYIVLAFLAITFTYFNRELRKHITGNYKKTDNK